MSVSTSYSAPCIHIYKTYTSKPCCHYQERINTALQMVRIQRLFCIFMFVWVFVRRSPAAHKSVCIFSFHVRSIWPAKCRFFGIESNCKRDILTLALLCRSSSMLFQGNCRLMEARWSPPCISPDREQNDWQWAVAMNLSSAPQNQACDGNTVVQEQQLLFLATKERAFPFTWDYS